MNVNTTLNMEHSKKVLSTSRNGANFFVNINVQGHPSASGCYISDGVAELLRAMGADGADGDMNALVRLMCDTLNPKVKADLGNDAIVGTPLLSYSVSPEGQASYELTYSDALPPAHVDLVPSSQVEPGFTFTLAIGLDALEEEGKLIFVLLGER